MFTVLIPARYASTRLPGKPLLDIAGKPMVVRVAERARASGAARVVVATDDERIRAAVADHGIDVLMTRSSHPTGTDRLAEAAAQLGLDDEAIVVKQVDKVEGVRGHLNKMRTLQLLRIRQVLSPEQRVKLNKIHDQWEKDHRRPPRPHCRCKGERGARRRRNRRRAQTAGGSPAGFGHGTVRVQSAVCGRTRQARPPAGSP